MLAKTLKRAGLGFLLGILVGNLISIFSGWPDALVTEMLLQKAGGLCAAFLWQTVLSGVLGAVSFAGMSLYEIESWSLLRIAVVHYLLIEAVYTPVAFALGWRDSLSGMLLWLLFSAVVYLIIFLIMCAVYRRQVQELNALNEQRKRRITEQKTGGAL